MSRRRHRGILLARAAATAWIGGTALGLATGAKWLGIDVLGTGLPLGTMATAVSMILLPALALSWAVDRWARTTAWLLVAAGALWLPVSAVLAGNLRLQFTNGPDSWWTVTRTLPLLAAALLLIVLAQAAWRRWRSGDPGAG